MPSTSLRASRLTTVAAASGATNWLNRATWKLFDGNTLSPLVQSGATSLGWLFDQTGTLRARPHNLLTFSEQFDNAVWGKTASSISANVGSAPNGTTTADKLVEDSTNNNHVTAQSFSFVAGADYTFSTYARAQERSFIRLSIASAVTANAVAGYDLSNGTVQSQLGGVSAAGVQSVGGGWFRVWMTVRATNTVSGNATIWLLNSAANSPYQGDGTSGIFIWGAQLNQGELQSYYPTTGAAFFGPRVSYDPANLSLGPFLLAEEARTNSIRNNTMQGAVAGVPGVVPNFWNISGSSNGLTREILGVFTASGAPSLRVRLSGTATATSAFSIWAEGTVGAVAAASGQVWTNSLFARVVAGTTSGLRMGLQEFDGSSGFLRGPELAVSVGSTLTRYTQTVTIGANTASIRAGCFIAYTSGQAVDVTLEIALNMLELGSTASSPILTFGTAVTRSADNLSVTNLGATGFNINECTVYAAWGCDVNTADNNHIVTVDNGGGLPTIAMRVGNNAGRRVRAYAQSAGGSFEYAVDAPVNASATLGRSAMSWLGTNNFVTADAGGLSPLDATGSIGAFSVNRISFGRNGASQSNMRIYQAAIIPQRIPDSALQRLTRV